MPARMRGIREAKAPVVVILDSHIEVNDGWLEPQLARIRESPKSFVFPQTLSIAPTTFTHSKDAGIGYIHICVYLICTSLMQMLLRSRTSCWLGVQRPRGFCVPSDVRFPSTGTSKRSLKSRVSGAASIRSHPPCTVGASWHSEKTLFWSWGGEPAGHGPLEVRGAGRQNMSFIFSLSVSRAI